MPEVRTNPPGADVFLNWVFQGKTPLDISDLRKGDRLLIFKDGYQGRYRTIAEPRSYYFKLHPAAESERKRVQLRVMGQDGPALRYLLVQRLIKDGFFVLTDEDALELETELQVAVEKSRNAFRAWASAKFRSHLWIVIRLPGSDPAEDYSRLLDPEDLTEVLNLATFENPYLSLKIIDLRSGNLFYQEAIESKFFYSTSKRRRAREWERIIEQIAAIVRDQIIGPSATEVPFEEPPETDED